MTKPETFNLIQDLAGLYPAVFKGMSAEKLGQIVSSWSDFFREYPEQSIRRAVRSLAGRSKFFPAVSEVLEELQAIETPDPYEEAFVTSLRRAYGDDLPEEVQKYLRDHRERRGGRR